MFICGSGSFPHNDDDDYYEYYQSQQCATPKKSKMSTSFSKIIGRDSGNKNPYADRGLDKFNALLADLDDKKQQIYMQMGGDQVSFVRFVYTNSKRVKPIIVRSAKEKKNKQDMMHSPKGTVVASVVPSTAETVPNVTGEVVSPRHSGGSESVQSEIVHAKEDRCCLIKTYMSNSGSFKLQDLKQPRYLIPVFLVLVLLLLAVFGRSLTILCTAILWYISPTINSSTSAEPWLAKKKPKTLKKEYSKTVSAINMVPSEGPLSPKTGSLTPVVTLPSKKKPKALKKVCSKTLSSKSLVQSEGPSSPTSVLTSPVADNRYRPLCPRTRRKSL